MACSGTALLLAYVFNFMMGQDSLVSKVTGFRMDGQCSILAMGMTLLSTGTSRLTLGSNQ
jgi:hypothetical protein